MREVVMFIVTVTVRSLQGTEWCWWQVKGVMLKYLSNVTFELLIPDSSRWSRWLRDWSYLRRLHAAALAHRWPFCYTGLRPCNAHTGIRNVGVWAYNRNLTGLECLARDLIEHLSHGHILELFLTPCYHDHRYGDINLLCNIFSCTNSKRFAGTHIIHTTINLIRRHIYLHWKHRHNRGNCML